MTKIEITKIHLLDNSNPHFNRMRAMSEGKTRYFTGKPCPKNHISERMVSSGYCCACLKERKLRPENVKRELARLKKDRETNPEKYKKIWSKQRLKLKNRITACVRVRVSNSIKEIYRSKNFDNIFGYSVDDLKLHIEKQFSKGMTWKNFGRNGWHIDHIIPVSLFTYKSYHDEEFKACWALSNLRPLWAADNHKKSKTRTHLI